MSVEGFLYLTKYPDSSCATTPVSTYGVSTNLCYAGYSSSKAANGSVIYSCLSGAYCSVMYHLLSQLFLRSLAISQLLRQWLVSMHQEIAAELPRSKRESAWTAATLQVMDHLPWLARTPWQVCLSKETALCTGTSMIWCFFNFLILIF